MLRILGAAARLALTLAVTFLGLLLVTFLIGRVVPIDPVLAVVGDRASAEVYEQGAASRWASTCRCGSSSWSISRTCCRAISAPAC